MISHITLPPELLAAASNLEERFRILGVSTRKVPLAEWSVLPEAAQNLVPTWLPTLLADFRLLGGVLECANNKDDATWPRYFGFIEPKSYQTIFQANDYCWNEEIFKEGLVPISFEADGDLWVTSSQDGPSSPIYLFSLTGMEKIFASARIALLMTSMAVSAESYNSFGKPDEPHSVMWQPGKE